MIFQCGPENLEEPSYISKLRKSTKSKLVVHLASFLPIIGLFH